MRAPEINVTVELADARTGRIHQRAEVANRTLPDGMKTAAQLLIGEGSPPYYIALGTDATPASDKDKSLGTEVFRNAITRRQELTAKARYQLQVTTTQANDLTIQEVGLFLATRWKYATAAEEGVTEEAFALLPMQIPLTCPRMYSLLSTGIEPLGEGILFARAVIPAFAKTVADTMTITWDLPISTKFSS